MIYPSKYSQINDLSKKERKAKQNQFPWLATNTNLSSSEWCGQLVSKEDKGSTIKFCPLCDQPMIVRMMIYPCEHCVCFSCSKPETDNCYVCDSKITNMIRIPDKAKLYDCDYPDCFKFFENNEKLGIHKYSIHNLQVEPSIIMKYNMMMHQMSQINQTNYPVNSINYNQANMSINSAQNLNQFHNTNMINNTYMPPDSIQ